MKNLHILSLCLSKLGMKRESSQITKYAQIGDLTSIGYPMIGARIINELVKDKWDLIVGKWLLDRYFDKLDIKSIIPNYFSFYEKNPIWQIKALNGCYLLLEEEISQRESLLNAKDDGSIMSLILWLEKKKYDQTEAYTEQEISDYDRKYLRRTSPISPDENIKGWASELEEEIRKSIYIFISTDFMQQVLSNKWLRPKALRAMSFNEALDKWLSTRLLDLKVELDMGDGWQWINAGNGSSEWVRENLKNCGSSRWGNLSASLESQEKAYMLVLIDEFKNPHGIATYNPEYVHYDNPKGKPKKYLGSIEGIGSSPIKQKYYPYVLKLIEYLKPDILKIESRTVYYETETVSNDDLMKAIRDKIGNIPGY